MVRPLEESKFDSQKFIEAFIVEWIRFKMLCASLIVCFGYLDRFCVRNNRLPLILENSFDLFKSVIYDRYRSELLLASQCSFKFPGDQRGNMLQICTQLLKELDFKFTNYLTRGFYSSKDIEIVQVGYGLRSVLNESYLVGLNDIIDVILAYTHFDDSYSCLQWQIVNQFTAGRNLCIQLERNSSACENFSILSIRDDGILGLSDDLQISMFSTRIVCGKDAETLIHRDCLCGCADN